MKNREKLANMALIDLLYKANGGENPSGANCILDELTESELPIPIQCPEKTSCYNCISAWLNEEAEKCT